MSKDTKDVKIKKTGNDRILTAAGYKKRTEPKKSAQKKGAKAK